MTVSSTHREGFRATWTDIDFNQHMANSAYLGYAGQTRMLYLDGNGWSMAQFESLQLGPVVVEDRLTYRRELRLLEEFTVDLALVGATSDVRKMAVRNRFHRRRDGELCATVDSIVLWFDLGARRPAAPPPRLRDLWLALSAADDFRNFDE